MQLNDQEWDLLKETVQNFLGLGGLSLHRKASVTRLLAENARLRVASNGARPSGIATFAGAGAGQDADLAEECRRLREELRGHQDRQVFYATTEDYNAHDKMRRSVDRIAKFGEADFAQLSSWLFAASLNNHRVIHQRIDEGSLLWQAVKMSGGPILEVGRAAGGSTLVLLGASGSRPVVSIDRAPFHAFIAEQVFERPDVASRLKLYRQSSREPIAETEFGMVFIDADHSYEGVCHDIAAFWNTLKPCDGRPALAVFHDAADNPITYVEPVKQACEELLAERNVARVVESWGSMLVLEKLGNIDLDRWFAKENPGFWEHYATREHPVLRPAVLRGRLRDGQAALRRGTVNLLGESNVDDESWVKRGLEVERAQLNEDNPLRLLGETPEVGEHCLEKTAALNLSRFNFSVFVRPYGLETIRLSVRDNDRTTLAYADFNIGNRARIANTFAEEKIEILDAQFHYRNGFFGCELAVGLPASRASAIVAASTLDADGGTSFPGNRERGFFMNLSSVRELL